MPPKARELKINGLGEINTDKSLSFLIHIIKGNKS